MERRYVFEGNPPSYRSAGGRPCLCKGTGNHASSKAVIRQVTHPWVESVKDSSAICGLLCGGERREHCGEH